MQKRKDYRALENVLSFAAIFIDRIVGHKQRAFMTTVLIHYSDIVSDTTGEMEQQIWWEKTPEKKGKGV